MRMTHRSKRNKLRTSRRYLIGKRTEARAAAVAAASADQLSEVYAHWYINAHWYFGSQGRDPVLISNSTGKPL